MDKIIPTLKELASTVAIFAFVIAVIAANIFAEAWWMKTRFEWFGF